MNHPGTFFPGPPQFQAQPPVQRVAPSFWQSNNVFDQLKKLQETIGLAKALEKELQLLSRIKTASQDVAGGDTLSLDQLLERERGDSQPVKDEEFIRHLEMFKRRRISLSCQEQLSIEAAKSLCSDLEKLLGPFNLITSQACPWEERSAFVKLSQKLQKSKRNKKWRKRKRKQIAELRLKELEDYHKADREADDWRARELAKDIAKGKIILGKVFIDEMVEKMKQISKIKANEERKRLESELELIIVVEKLQELRSIRIKKLQKQGHFLPEEDDKFLERVQAAVEEEERQAAAAADTGAAKGAIATAEESRNALHGSRTEVNDKHQHQNKVSGNHQSEASGDHGQESGKESEKSSIMESKLNPQQPKVDNQVGGSYDSLAHLPPEYFHYYHGSNYDLGTLIQVRREWDAYIRPGGSRIPGNWVQPPPPADEVWASYLIHRK